MLNNDLLHVGPDINHWRVRRKRMMILTLMLTIFGAIVMV
jgi:hypothetical protein